MQIHISKSSVKSHLWQVMVKNLRPFLIKKVVELELLKFIESIEEFPRSTDNKSNMVLQKRSEKIQLNKNLVLVY